MQYAVIFVSKRSELDPEGYKAMSAEMVAMVSKQEGFLWVDSVFDAAEQTGITVSYWKDLASIKKWKGNARHKQAQAEGRRVWYSSFDIHVTKVKRSKKMGSKL